MDRVDRRQTRISRGGVSVTRMRWFDAVLVFGAVVGAVAALGASDPVGDPARDAAGDPHVEASSSVDDQPGPEAAAPEETLSARERYNAGIEDLEQGDFAAAAEDFLAARDDARGDPLLRYRSAFNLGLALAGQADGSPNASPNKSPDSPGKTDPEETIETLRSSAAWFSDAARLAPEGDEDARVNLEIVLRRIQQLADQVNRDGHLEARLDRIIDDQRGLRDQLRQLLADVESEEGGDFRHRFESLAASERALLAETADVADLAAEERAHLEAQGEQALAPEQRGRAYQLGHMDHYLQRARQSMSDTRRRLRRLEGERAHRRADTALGELKRAREQLSDPVAVLKAVARDEESLVGHAGALASIAGDDEAGPPPWLTIPHLVNRQEDAAARTGEMLRRLEAAIAAAEDVPTGEPSGDPQADRTRQSIGEAIPHVREALDAMRSALSAFGGAAVSDAAREGAQAVAALARAIERFAGLRELIEITYADQARAVAILGAESEDVPAEFRERLAGVAIDENRERLQRMEGMLLEMVEQAPPEGEEATAGERYELAETLRGEALEALDAATRALKSGGGADILAGLALERLEALRRLFFSIVEHLQELLAEQTDTHDQTATVQVEPETAPPLGFIAERQETHARTGAALGEALAAQTDAARGEDAQAGENIAEATRELRAGTSRMRGAAGTVSAAAEAAERMSPHLEPALADQVAAIGHIENAIRLLRPPDDQDAGGEQQQQQQQQQQTAAAQPEPAEQMSRRQALQRLQAVRDREAERQRRRQRDPAPPDPVEKDW